MVFANFFCPDAAVSCPNDSVFESWLRAEDGMEAREVSNDGCLAKEDGDTRKPARSKDEVSSRVKMLAVTADVLVFLRRDSMNFSTRTS